MNHTDIATNHLKIAKEAADNFKAYDRQNLDEHRLTTTRIERAEVRSKTWMFLVVWSVGAIVHALLSIAKEIYLARLDRIS